MDIPQALIAENSARRAAELTMTPEQVMELVANDARARGFAVSLELQQRRLSYCSRSLVINGKRCALLHTTNLVFTSRTGKLYSRFEGRRRRLEKVAFAIIAQEHLSANRLWVVPAHVLLSVIGTKKRGTFYLPVERNRTDALPVIDWWHYEGAWHLLA